MKYYIAFEEYTAPGLPQPPNPQNLQHRRTDVFVYENGALQPVNHNAVFGRKEFSSAGVFLTEVPNDTGAKAFFTIDCHPKRIQPDRQVWGTWVELGFWCKDTHLVLEHGGDSTFDANEGRGPTWLKLFSGTKHLAETTAPGPQRLSGRLAIFWGLVALRFGSQYMDNLGNYFLNQDRGLSMIWPTGHEPDGTTGRVVAVTIYLDLATTSEKLEQAETETLLV